MSEIRSSRNGYYETAVAAAAFAITTLEEDEEDGFIHPKRQGEESRKSLTKTKSKREESMDKPSGSKISRWFSGKEATEDGRAAGEGSMRKSSTFDQKNREESAAVRKVPRKATGTTPKVKKTLTFSDKYLNDTDDERFEREEGLRTWKRAPSTMKPPSSSPGNGNLEGYMVDSSQMETEADVWQKAKMDKINKRNEKTISTIQEWENEKKTKAERRLERKEVQIAEMSKLATASDQREIEERRARVLQEYHNEMSRVDKISGGARAVADARKRNEESKTIEKAEVLRLTGKLPKECFCC